MLYDTNMGNTTEKLKLVRLVANANDDSLDLALVRLASVALAKWACDGSNGRLKGDPIFNSVTEGRQRCWVNSEGKQVCYSACGDLPHFIIWNLAGKPDPSTVARNAPIRAVNRQEAFGWQSGKNIILLGTLTPGKTTYKLVDTFNPPLGSVLLMGRNGNEHVCIVESYTEDDLHTYDYGQFFSSSTGLPANYGGCAVRRYLSLNKDNFIWASRQGYQSKPLIAYVDIGQFIVSNMPAITNSYVPDSFEGGIDIADDNPY